MKTKPIVLLILLLQFFINTTYSQENNTKFLLGFNTSFNCTYDKLIYISNIDTSIMNSSIFNMSPQFTIGYNLFNNFIFSAKGIYILEFETQAQNKTRYNYYQTGFFIRYFINLNNFDIFYETGLAGGIYNFKTKQLYHNLKKYKEGKCWIFINSIGLNYLLYKNIFLETGLNIQFLQRKGKMDFVSYKKEINNDISINYSIGIKILL